MKYSEIIDKDILQFYYEVLSCTMKSNAPAIYCGNEERYIIIKELRKGNSKKIRMRLALVSENECAAVPITARQIYEYLQVHGGDIVATFSEISAIFSAYGEMLQAVESAAHGEESARNWGEMWREMYAYIYETFCKAAQYDKQRNLGGFLQSLYDLHANSPADVPGIDAEANANEVQRFCADELRTIFDKAAADPEEPQPGIDTEYLKTCKDLYLWNSAQIDLQAFAEKVVKAHRQSDKAAARLLYELYADPKKTQCTRNPVTNEQEPRRKWAIFRDDFAKACGLRLYPYKPNALKPRK